MKIAYVTTKFPLLSETFIYEELLALNKLGHLVELFPFYATGEKSHKYTTELVPMVTYLPNLVSLSHLRAQIYYIRNDFQKYREALTEIVRETWKSPEKLMKSIYAFSKGVMLAYQVREKLPDHLHAHWATMPTTAVDVAGQLLGIPFSFTAHAWDIFKQPLMLDKKLEKAAFAVTISDYNQKYLGMQHPKNRQKIHVVRCGVNLDRFKFSADHIGVTPPTILFVGRLVEKKGAEVLIRACGLLKTAGFHFQCVLVGGGPLYDRLEKLSRKLEVDDQVLLTEGLDQESLRAYWQTASVFVLPSVIAANNDRDGIPVALMEAMALGVPVITSTISGIPELVEDHKSGLLVSPGDEAELANAIIEILSDKAKAVVYARNARQKIEAEYDISLNALQKADLFAKHIDKER